MSLKQPFFAEKERGKERGEPNFLLLYYVRAQQKRLMPKKKREGIGLHPLDLGRGGKKKKVEHDSGPRLSLNDGFGGGDWGEKGKGGSAIKRWEKGEGKEPPSQPICFP